MSRIAIIGFQGRFPGNAKSSVEFFEQLLAAESFCSAARRPRALVLRVECDVLSADRSRGSAFGGNRDVMRTDELETYAKQAGYDKLEILPPENDNLALLPTHAGIDPSMTQLGETQAPEPNVTQA